MLNKFIITALVIFITSCSQQQPADSYTISGTIEGVNSGTVKLVRSARVDKTSPAVDSTDLANGKFVLKGKLKAPELMKLVIEPGNWSFEIFVENGKITIEADTTASDHFDYTAYGMSKGAMIKKYTISGSESENQWTKFINDPRVKAYEQEFKNIDKAFTAARGNAAEQDRLRAQADSLRPLLMSVQKHWIDSFVAAKPSAASGAWMLYYYYQFNNDMPIHDMEVLVEKFTGTARSSEYFTMLSDVIQKRKALLPGGTAPDFTLLKPDSSSFSLSSLRGKYVLLDFWASWCKPCREAIPHWKEVYKKYQSKGFEVLSVTNDSRWSDWHKALEEEKMPWLQVADEFPIKNTPARVATLYMIPYLPTYILLDKEGKVIVYNGGEQEIDKKLNEIFP